MEHRRILVADRNAGFLKKTAEILKPTGLQVITVSNGGRALSQCQHERPELVLVHVDLPTLPGTEVSFRLKDEIDPNLPVVLMFSGETDRVEDITRQSKADNYLIRPLKRTELLFCVRSMLQLRTMMCQHGNDTKNSRPGTIGMDVFHTFLELEIQRVDRYGFPLTLLSMALDPLPEDAGMWSKALDEQLGPALANGISSCVRDIDLSVMINSREMMVLMPHTGKEGACIVAKRICDEVSSRSYHFGRARIQPTVSVGVVCVHGERTTLDDVLKRSVANRARAADAGGNRLCAD